MISPIRMSGIASGMDTEAMVKKMMTTERNRLDRFSQQKIYKSWQQESFREVNKTLANFVLDSRKKLELTRVSSLTGALQADSISNVSWIKSASTSNDKAFEVSADATTPTGNFSLEIKSLAASANASSTESTGFKHDTKVAEAFGIAPEGTMTVKINDQEIKLNGADTLSDMSKKIKNATGLNVNFDSGASRLFVSSKKTGSEAKIEFGTGADTEKFLNAMKINATAGTAVTGTNASIVFNGGTPIEYQSNNISINGLNLNLKATTEKVETVTVNTDVDGAYKKIKEFVEDYNKLIDGLSNKLEEKKYKDYQPLTDEQRKAMSESDVKLWEEKAKSGLLYRDETVENMLQSIRNEMYNQVNGAGSLYEFGITTGNWKDKGKLVIDEEKLKTALRNEPDRVLDTMFKSNGTAEAKIYSSDSPSDKEAKLAANKERNDNSGIFTRVYDKLMNGMENIVQKSGPGNESALLKDVRGNMLLEFATKFQSKSSIDNEILSIGKRIEVENERITRIENRYWSQFSAMEKAMQQMQSQSSWLSQQFSQGL